MIKEVRDKNATLLIDRDWNGRQLSTTWARRHV